MTSFVFLAGITLILSPAISESTVVLSIQVNEKFHKLERVYRDCIKMTRDKTRIYSILHDAPGT